MYGSSVDLTYNEEDFSLQTQSSGSLVAKGLSPQQYFEGTQGSYLGRSIQRETVLALRLGDQIGASGDGSIAVFTFMPMRSGEYTFAIGSSLDVKMVTSTGSPVSFAAGNPITVNVTGPKITSPENGFYSSANAVTVSGNGLPGSILIPVVDGTDQGEVAVSEQGTFSVAVNLTADGSHTIQMREKATGALTNAVTVVLDTVAPTVGFSAYVQRGNQSVALGPTSLARGGETVFVEVTAGEQLKGNPAIALDKLSTGDPVVAGTTYTYSVNVPADYNETVNLTATVTDLAGHESTEFYSFKVDSTLPAITVDPFTSPVKADAATLTFAVADANLATVKANGTPVTAGGDGKYTYTLALSQDGENELIIDAIDYASNGVQQQVVVVRDTTGPGVDDTPAHGSYVGVAKPVISAFVTDSYSAIDVQTAQMTVRVGGVAQPLNLAHAAEGSGVRFTATLADNLPLTGGQATVNVAFVVDDQLGNRTSSSWDFHVDTNFPAVTPSTLETEANENGWFNEELDLALTVAGDAPVRAKLVEELVSPPELTEADLYDPTTKLHVGEGRWTLWYSSYNPTTERWSPVMPVGTYRVDTTAPALPTVQVSTTDDKDYLKAGDSFKVVVLGEPEQKARVDLEYQDWVNGQWEPVRNGSDIAEVEGLPGRYELAVTLDSEAMLRKEIFFIATLTDLAGNASQVRVPAGFEVDTIAPAITSVTHDAGLALAEGDTLTVTAAAEPGLAALTRILLWTVGTDEQSNPTVPTGDPEELAVTESSPGLYTAAYTVKAGENRFVQVTAVQTDLAGNEAETKAAPTLVAFKTTGPQITAVEVVDPAKVDQASGVAHYKAGDVVTIEITGSKGIGSGRVVFELATMAAEPVNWADVYATIPGINGAVKIPLTETGELTGVYRGTYTVQPTDNIGPVKVQATMVDPAGNTATAESDQQIVLDNVAPTYVGLSATASTILKAGDSFKILALAEPNLKQVDYRFTLAGDVERTGTLLKPQIGSGTYSAVYTVAPGENTLPEGALISLVLTDYAGNTTEGQTTRPIRIDTTAPAISALSVTLTPVPEANDTLTISFDSEAGLLASATVDGLFAGRPFTYANGTYTLTFEVLPGVNVANADVTVVAVDAAGNTTEETMVDGVTIDTIAPYASVKVDQQPRGLHGWYVTQPKLTIVVEEGATLTLQNGSTEITLDAPTTANGKDTYTYAVPDGEHIFTFTAEDGAGNTTVGSLPAMKVDTTMPGAPTGLSASITSKVQRIAAVTGTIADLDADRVAVWVNGQNVGLRQVDGAGAFSLGGIPLVESVQNKGTNMIEIAVIDAAGNVGEKSGTQVILDTTPPTLGITLGDGVITVKASEPLTGAPTLTARVNGNPVELSPLTPIDATTWEATVAAALTGTYSINAQGADAAGNVGYGNMVSVVADPTQETSVTTDDGNVTVNFGAGDLAETAVRLSTYLDENLHTFAPAGTQILGSAYQFSATLNQNASVDVTFQVAITGEVPERLGIYYLPLEKAKAVELVWGTTQVVSTNGDISVVKVSATLPHFSVWAPFADKTAPEYVGAIEVDGDATADQIVNTPTVTVSGTVDGTTDRVEVTGGTAAVTQQLNAASAGNQNFNLTVNLGTDGPKTLTVKAYDAFGNWNSQEISLTLDTADPTVTGVKVNGNAYAGTVYTTSSTASMVASSNDQNALLTVKKGEAILLADAQSVNLTLDLAANTSNTFTIEAKDLAGNVGASTVTIVNDTKSPVLTINNLPTMTGSATVTFTYSVDEAGTVELTGADGATVNRSGNQVQLTFAADGTYSLTFTVTDLAGNVTTTTRTVVYDTAVPIVTATATPNPTTGSSTLTVTAVDNADAQINGEVTITVGESTLVTADPIQGTKSYELTTLAEGANTVQIEVTNTTNGLTGDFSLTVTKDTTDPSVTLAVPQTTTDSSSMTVTVTLDEAARIQMQRLVGETWVNVGNQTGLLTAGAQSVALTLSSGSYQYRAEATDPAGNTGDSNAIAITYNRPTGGGGGGAPSTPAPSIIASVEKSLTNLATANIRGTATAGAVLKIARGTTTLKTLTVDASGSFSYTADLVEGENRFTLTVTNAGGLASTTVIVTRDSTAPALSVSAPTEVREAKAELTVATEPKATLFVNGEAVGTAPASGTLTLTVNLQEGTNTFSLYVEDAVGNKSAEQSVAIRYQPVTQPAEPTEPVTPPNPPALVLTDIEGHWAEEAVRELVATGILSGMGDGTFRPEASVTRAQFAKMIVLALGLPVEPKAELTLADADQIPEWARPYVAAAMKAGLITGYEDGTFRADDQISRLQIAVIVGRALALKGVAPAGEAKQFTDRDQIPTWALAQFDAATQAGLISGFEDGSFRPDQNATRAQAAVLILRLISVTK